MRRLFAMFALMSGCTPATQRPPAPPPAGGCVLAQTSSPPAPDALVWFAGDRYAHRGLDFELDADRLRPASEPTIAALAQLLLESPTVAIEIQVHAGTDNPRARDLSRRRAEAVRSLLTSHGIAPARLAVRACPELPPISHPPEPPGGWSRRVEFVVTP